MTRTEMEIKIALAGNPNCGKTTLFNATGTMNSYYDALVRHEQRRKYDWMDDLDG